MIRYQLRGFDEFQRAIAKAPRYAISRANTFIVRGLAEYRRVIMRNPWKFGMSGGGAPVKTGNLRDTHQQVVSNLEGRIFPTASYAKYIHGISGFPRRRSYQLRPWLDYAQQTAQSAIDQHERDLIDDIITQLAA